MQSDSRKTVLVVAYYFPPMGSSGVQRPLKFVKYLQHFGWKPVVLAPQPGLYTHFDESLQAELDSIEPAVEVHRVKGNTPFDKAAGRRAIGNLPDWMAGPARILSSLFFLPDNKKGWIQPALEKAAELHQKHNFDAIFATAPPYSNLMLAAELKTKTGIPVMMDFRDDWYGSHLLTYPTFFHRKKMKELESKCLKSADMIIAINRFMLDSLKSRNNRAGVSFEVLEQGYDPEDVSQVSLDGIKEDDTPNSGVIRILYNGLFYGENQPDTFLKGVSLFLQEHPEYYDMVELIFQGGLQPEHRTLIKNLGMTKLIRDRGYLNHKKALKGLAEADLVWFVVGHKKSPEQVTTGKLFEYIGSRKVILGLVPAGGEAARVLQSVAAGFVADPHNAVSVKKALIKIFSNMEDLKRLSAADDACLRYSRITLTRKLSALLDKLAANTSRNQQA